MQINNTIEIGKYISYKKCKIPKSEIDVIAISEE